MSSIRKVERDNMYFSVVAAVGILVVCMYLIRQFPMAAVLQCILPFPIVILSLRCSSAIPGIVTVVFATIIMMIGIGYWAGTVFLLGTGVAAIILTFGFLRKWSATATMCVVCLYFLTLLGLIVSGSQGYSIDAHTQKLTEAVKTQFFSVYEQQHLAWQQVEKQVEVIATVVTTIFPLITAIGVSSILYVVTRSLLKTQRVELRPRGRFYEWEVSEHFLWLVMLAGGLYHFQTTRAFGINLLIGLVLLYYLQGSALVIFFLKQRQAARGMQGIAYGLLFLQIPYIFGIVGLLLVGYRQEGLVLSLPAIFIVTGMGLANVWYGFRGRIKGGLSS